jgi:hypothetical protein
VTRAELRSDQRRLLILISRYSRPARSGDDEDMWIKKIPLLVLIHRGIKLNIFKDYDFAPTLVEYLGNSRFANISQEGEDDVARLREAELVERLKLATSHHVYVSAYRVTEKGMATAKRQAVEHQKAVSRLTACGDCGGELDVETRPDAPYLVCLKCKRTHKVDIFDIEKVPYRTSTVFSDIIPPPD